MAPLLRLSAVLLAAVAISACQPETPAAAPGDDAPALEGGPSGPAPAGDQAGSLDGAPIDLTPGGQPSESPCALFSATEIGAFMGKMVAEGERQDETCIWNSANADGFVTVQVAPAARHAPPTANPGYETLPQISGSAYVAPVPDGYAGGALDGEEAVVISVSGILNGRDIAMELLRQAVERND